PQPADAPPRRSPARAVFSHVEIWKDYDQQVLNQAAWDWLQMPNGDLTEPGLFLIGADGPLWGAGGGGARGAGRPPGGGAPADARVAARSRTAPTYGRSTRRMRAMAEDHLP